MNIYAMRLKTGEEVIFRTETNFDKLVESINQNILIEVDKPVTMFQLKIELHLFLGCFLLKVKILLLALKMWFYFITHKNRSNPNIGE